ncbi:MAG TPA: hypothetical protein VF928_02150, partial [Usitatibacteraceae bacterium]
ERGARRSGPREEHDSGRPRRDYTTPAPQPALAGATAGFDFSKPYEPTVKDDEAGTETATATVTNRRQMPRSIGALLGRRNQPKPEE